MSNAYAIGRALVTEIEQLLLDVSDDVGVHSTVSRTYTLPTVSFRKRRSGAGRELTEMRIYEGITVVPLKPKRSLGDNERDGIGYRYMVAIASGTYRDILDSTSANDWPTAEWEEAIRRRFHNKRIGSISNLTNTCEIFTQVEPGELPQWAKLDEGLDSTYLIITEYVRENRRDDS